VNQLLLDENLASLYREQLLRHNPGLVIRRIGGHDAPEIGTLDPDLLVWCEEHDFVLVTNNRKTMPVHLADHLIAGRHVPGIIAIRRRARIGEVLDHVLAVLGASFENEYRDRLLYMPLQ
jgi:hypothetical protein